MSFDYAVGFVTGCSSGAALAFTTYQGGSLLFQGGTETKRAWYSAAMAATSARIIAHLSSLTSDFGCGVSDGASMVGSIVSYVSGMKMAENSASKELSDYKARVSTHKYTVETATNAIVPFGIPSIIIDMMIPREYQLLRGALPIITGSIAVHKSLAAVKK